MCSDKLSYPSLEVASAVARKRMESNPGLWLYVYQCLCDQWHLTKAENVPTVAHRLIEIPRPKPARERHATITDLVEKYSR